ncbi:hypothetical protein Dimus_036872, partial [Dionaea muscipula]
KPPIEELAEFLDFQLPRQWAPAYGDLPLRLRRKKDASPYLQDAFMGPKLYISTDPLVTRAAAADDHKYFEPIKSGIFSHISHFPVEHNGSCIEVSASIVTKARLEVKVIGMKKILFMIISFVPTSALVTIFNLEIRITGAILTKLDGDSRGGAAPSVKEVKGDSSIGANKTHSE